MTRNVTSFARTMRALDADGLGPALLGIILVSALGGVWTTWLLIARVPVYQLSDSARLEVERVHPVASPVGGRVIASSLALGREVQAGDVLLDVESERASLETAEVRTRLPSLDGEIDAIRREILAEEQAIAESARAARAGLAEASERLSAAEAGARQSRDKLGRLELLERQGLIAAAEADAARADERARRAELAAARAGIDKMKAEQTAAERDRRGRLASLIRGRANLEGLKAATTATVARREREADLRRIRAPVSGRLGEVNPIQPGAVIGEGDRLASIIPAGQVRAVASFGAPALGRLRPGQRARVRLDGFPWTQYGHVEATVTTVASETREQRIRVELALLPVGDSPIPLQHGMPGVVEIEVERVAPLALVVRTLGHALTPGAASAAATPAPAGRQ